jgi:hypothetical protein
MAMQESSKLFAVFTRDDCWIDEFARKTRERWDRIEFESFAEAREWCDIIIAPNFPTAHPIWYHNYDIEIQELQPAYIPAVRSFLRTSRGWVALGKEGWALVAQENLEHKMVVLEN